VNVTSHKLHSRETPSHDLKSVRDALFEGLISGRARVIHEAATHGSASCNVSVGLRV